MDFATHPVLLTSIAVLLLGPLIHQLARRQPIALEAVDGFVLVAIGGLVFVDVLPTAWSHIGWPALVLAGAGYFLPGLAEGRFGFAASHRAAVWFALLGLSLHAATDGLAIAAADSLKGRHGHLDLAVVLHRIPEAIGVWWLWGAGRRRSAVLALALVAVATVLGFQFGEVHAGWLDGGWQSSLMAFVGGLLLHVVHHTHDTESTRGFGAGLGGLVALALLVGVLGRDVHESHDPHVYGGSDTGQVFVDLFDASAPALLLAYLMAGLLTAWLGDGSARWLRRGRPWDQALRGVAFGLPLPLCSCGVVPVYRGLVRGGVPATAGLAFLIATPELGIDAVLLSVPLLGVELTVLRVAAAFVLALGVGWMVGRVVPTQGLADDASSAEGPRLSMARRIRAGLSAGFGELVDGTVAWILVGLVVAALLEPVLDPQVFAALPPWLQVPAFVGLGMPLYVCAAGATPLVAVLVAKGLSPGAALAFLLTGPATNVTTYGVLRQLHGSRTALRFATSVAVGALILGYVVNLMWADGLEVPAAILDHEDTPSWWRRAASWMLTAVFLWSFVRQGPRRLLASLRLRTGDEHEHDHGHGHGPGLGHGHAHGHSHAHRRSDRHEHDHAHDHDHGHDHRQED